MCYCGATDCPICGPDQGYDVPRRSWRDRDDEPDPPANEPEPPDCDG